MPRSAIPPSESLTLTVDEAAAILRISRGAAYEAVRQGTIPALRLGRRILVPTAALLRLLGGESPDEVNPAHRLPPQEQRACEGGARPERQGGHMACRP